MTLIPSKHPQEWLLGPRYTCSKRDPREKQTCQALSKIWKARASSGRLGSTLAVVWEGENGRKECWLDSSGRPKQWCGWAKMEGKNAEWTAQVDLSSVVGGQNWKERVLRERLSWTQGVLCEGKNGKKERLLVSLEALHCSVSKRPVLVTESYREHKYVVGLFKKPQSDVCSKNYKRYVDQDKQQKYFNGQTLW